MPNPRKPDRRNSLISKDIATLRRAASESKRNLEGKFGKPDIKTALNSNRGRTEIGKKPHGLVWVFACILQARLAGGGVVRPGRAGGGSSLLGGPARPT